MKSLRNKQVYRRNRVKANSMSRLWKQSFIAILLIALVVTTIPMAPGMGWEAYGADELSGIAETPLVAVTGQGVLGASAYSAENVGNEKAYTLGELKEIAKWDVTASVNNRYLYSAYNTYDNASIYLGEGVKVDTLLAKSGVVDTDLANSVIGLMAPDGYAVKYDPSKTTVGVKEGANKSQHLGIDRYYYPGIEANGIGSDENPVEVPTILAWARGGEKGLIEEPSSVEQFSGELKSLTGQIALNDYNHPLFNGEVSKVLVGDELTETAITFDGVEYTRSEILMMDRADRSYTYVTKAGDKTKSVRGVPLAVLLSAYGDDDTVTFTTADNYPKGGFDLTVAELKASNYILAYEEGENEFSLTSIYETAKNDSSTYGFFTLYGDGDKPYKLIDSITVTPASGIDFVNSDYKHINNGGKTGQDGPYDIDAITGATLTIEGPGVESSVPLPIRELETQNAGAHRGVYSDSRDGTDYTLQYEGVRLSYIVNDMASGDNGIIMTDNAYRVLLKNRVRQTIAEFTLDEIEEAEKAGSPIIIAYGTATTEGAIVSPFVFDGGAGYRLELDNDDGPIKLVYDKGVFSTDPNPEYTEFGNTAYIYITEESNPGYKHDIDPYKTAENSQYVLTVTGDKIGREVNYTVQQLEGMVDYDDKDEVLADSMGYREEYSLSNSTYWYVNEYEGVQLWKLLQKSGLAADLATGVEKDTFVSFSATDNYKDFDKFTIEQVSKPDLFKFYEKNPDDLDDGNYVSDDETDRRNAEKDYPVLVAYGVNSYPYVINSKLDGFMSGLSNDGGPLRIISGKTDYHHANGSKQAKLLDKIIVGEDKYYSTHKYNPTQNGVYQDIANNSKLEVNVFSSSDSGTALKEETYTVGELEEIIYGGSLTNAQLKEAKVKDFYENKKGTNFYSDLYEGIDLIYFLENVVQLPGYKGTINFSNDTETLSMDLEEVLKFSGFNGSTNLSGLSPVLAYAKNGAPMVNSKDALDGYEDKVVLAEGTIYEHEITVKNNGGPLAVMFPREAMDSTTAETLTNVTSITIDLTADKYAHTDVPYNDLAGNTITITGEGTRLSEEKIFTVADIEGKQILAVTGDYNIKKATSEESQIRYRGIPLYAFLNSTDVGLKPNADKVIVTSSDGTFHEFALAEIIKSDYINGQNPEINDLKTILAYGSAPVTNVDIEDGKPLVQSETTDAGYDELYKNIGGPIRLVVGQTDVDDINCSGKILKDVISIEVTASEMVSWNHSTSPVYEKYLDSTFEFNVIDGSGTVLFEKTYTVEELEAMESLVEREFINWTAIQEWEGINLWKFALQEAKGITGMSNPTSVTVSAADGFSKELRSIFGLDALENGIKDGETRIPIILGYAVKGYPLVPDNTDDGYTALADNSGGPLRLMTNGNQGACLSDTVKMVVKVGATGTDPEPSLDHALTIKGWGSSDITYDIGGSGGIKGLDGGKSTASYSYTSKDVGYTDSLVGIKLIDLLTYAEISGDDVRVAINTTDGYTNDTYETITLDDIEAKEYFVAYDCNDGKIADVDKNNVEASLRIYRNFDDGSSWKNRITNISGITVTKVNAFTAYSANGDPGNLPLAGIRSVWMDDAEGLWVSTYGGGVAYKAKSSDTFTVYNKESSPALETAIVSAVAVDSEGGVWITQNASYTNPNNNKGVVYMKDGVLTNYRASDNPKTIADDYVQEIQIDDSGNVWFGSFGGLTKYDPAEDTWTTWNQNYVDRDGDTFPALSVDNLNLDGKGGVWLGFYPTGAGTETDPFVGGFAHMDSTGDITPYQYTADYDSQLGSSLLAQVWVRDIAVDNKDGAWVIASGSFSDLSNVGGNVWYVDANGDLTEFTGDQLLGEGTLTGNSELRMVTVDPEGGLWFGTSADGIIYVENPGKAAPLGVTEKYKGSLGYWPNIPKSNVWDNIYSLDFFGATLYAGSSAGLVSNNFSFGDAGEDPEPGLDHAFTIEGWKNSDITYDIGGSGGIKRLDGGKSTASYSYTLKGVAYTDSVVGIKLIDLLTHAEISGDDVRVAINTTDGYTNDTYEAITLADIEAKEYFLAYDCNNDKISDVDDNDVEASLRIYRNFDDGSGWKNRITNISGLIITKVGDDPAGDIPAEYDLMISGKGVIKDTYLTVKELKNAPATIKMTREYHWLNSYGTSGADTFEGIYLDNLLEDVVGITSKAKSVTIAAEDGYNRSFNIDSNELGVNWVDTSGNKLMLAWKQASDKIDLKLVVGQIDKEHVNKPMWISDVVSIIVNTSSTSSGSGTTGQYEGKPDNDKDEGTPEGTPLTQKEMVKVRAQTKVTDGTATTNISSGDLGSALRKINDSKTGQGIIRVDATSSSDNVKKIEANIPMGSLEDMAKTGKVSAAIQTDIGTITLDPAILEQLAKLGGKNLSISIEIADKSLFSEEELARAGGRPILDIKVAVDGKAVTSFGGRTIMAGIPYKAADEENENNLIVVYMDGPDKGKPVKLSLYNDDAEELLLRTKHLSLYGVVSRSVTFSDIKGHWAASNIEFLANRDIIKGKGLDYFDPNGNVTRAEFITMLANSMDGINVADSKIAGFDDVRISAWYSDYVNWAVANGIVNGYGDGRFGPNDKITREQMALMTDNFIDSLEIKLDVVKDKTEFEDGEVISKWSKDAVVKIQQYGIISGKPDGKFAPKANATRAEAAVVLNRYIESMIK